MPKVFILQKEIEGGMKIEGSERIDDRRRELTFLFPEEKRNEITKVRAKYVKKIEKCCIDFYGIKLLPETDVDAVGAILNECRAEIQKLEPSLTVKLNLTPLELNENDNIISLMRSEVKKSLFANIKDKLERLKDKNALHGKTKNIIIKTLEELREKKIIMNDEMQTLIDKYVNTIRDAENAAQIIEMVDADRVNAEQEMEL